LTVGRTRAEDHYLPAGWLMVRVRDPQASPDGHAYAIAALACSAACLATVAQEWAAATG
jgi:hypothetical protein